MRMRSAGNSLPTIFTSEVAAFALSFSRPAPKSQSSRAHTGFTLGARRENPVHPSDSCALRRSLDRGRRSQEKRRDLRRPESHSASPWLPAEARTRGAFAADEHAALPDSQRRQFLSSFPSCAAREGRHSRVRRHELPPERRSGVASRSRAPFCFVECDRMCRFVTFPASAAAIRLALCRSTIRFSRI